MNSASATRQAPELSAASARSNHSRWIIAVVLMLAPMLAGLAWHHASDDPLWHVFRSSLNLCSLQQAELSPVSPDGRFQVHIVHATCATRFPETMLFLSEANEPFTLDGLDPNRAVLEIAGNRTLDAVTWTSGAEAPNGRMSLHLWMVEGSVPSQLHRVDSHWRDVPIVLDQSQPAPGAERLDY